MRGAELKTEEYHSYYQPYIEKVGAVPVLEVLRSNAIMLTTFIRAVDKEKLTYRYADGKWTIKEILLHLIDTERVFAYRALCIARKDKTDFPGFDQDAYVAYSEANNRTLDSLLTEFANVRAATVSLFENFSTENWFELGTASHSAVSVRAIAFIIVGHENHHLQLIKSRYL